MHSARRGLSLIEAIMSIFLVIVGFLIMGQLFHSAIHYETLVTERTTAAAMAEHQMEKIRGWSAQVFKGTSGGSAFDDATWAGCPGNGGPNTDPLYPGYFINVTTSMARLYSPCTQFETKNDQPNSRAMNNSTRRVDIIVSWSSDSQFALSSLISLPTGEPAAVNPVQVAAVAPLARDARSNTSVTLTNAAGHILPDAFFSWELNPKSTKAGFPNPVGAGVAASDPSRDGRSAAIANFVYATIPPDTAKTGWAPGKTLLVATARYRGRKVQGAAQLDLQP